MNDLGVEAEMRSRLRLANQSRFRSPPSRTGDRLAVPSYDHVKLYHQGLVRREDDDTE